ncbi:MAG: aspartate aminotransferase family protein [Edaphobacter sp.]|nr:aspartate aminotransferase family protein [Edaphobacter sp.]
MHNPQYHPDMLLPDSPLQPLLQSTLTHALTYLSPANETSVAATASLQSLRQRLDLPLADDGLPAPQVIDDLVAAVAGGLHKITGGRFYGWVNGGSLPAALAADWLTSAWDQNASLYTVGPAASVVEEVVGAWLKDLLHLPATASFALVTGCQMSHVTCLLAARHSVLARAGWDVEQDGLQGAPRIRILTSSERHGSTVRAIRILGLGEKSIVDLPTDPQGRLLADTLEQHLATEPNTPTIVVLQAGDLNIGAYDDFETLIPIAHRYNAWVHIDGAFGLWAAATPTHRHLMRGAAKADSWATDGHKWLNVPYDCGYAFVADPASHRAALTLQAAYITHDTDARDPIDWNPEWSRRARGFATYAALRQLGRTGVASLIDRCCEHAHALVTRIGNLPGAQVLWEPQINQGLLRFLDPRPNATEADHDAHTIAIIVAIQASGEAFFTGTTWRGRRAMRVSVCNWQTSIADVDRIVQCVAEVLKTNNTQT